MIDDFLVVGPVPEAACSRFYLFRWYGYRETSQGYIEVSSTRTHRVSTPLQLLPPGKAMRQLPHLTPWIESVIEEEDD